MCNFIIFSRTNKKIETKIKLNKVEIPRCQNIKFLGVTLDERLNLKEHITNVKNECRIRLNALKIVSHKSWHLSKTVLKQIYHSIIRSKIEYCHFVYECGSESAKQIMRVIQNNALRSIYKKKRQFGNIQLHELAQEISIDT